MSARAILAGVVSAALRPVLWLLGVSLAGSLAAAWTTRELPTAGVLAAHAMLLAQALFFAVLGLWLAGRVRHPALAIPLAAAVLAAVTVAIWMLNPFYRALADPGPWIYAALLPNPVTAAGAALDTDVLRFSWIYQHVHAHEYLFVYPPAWQTAGLYSTAAGILAMLLVRRIR
jgi:hypothetical protein